MESELKNEFVNESQPVGTKRKATEDAIIIDNEEEDAKEAKKRKEMEGVGLTNDNLDENFLILRHFESNRHQIFPMDGIEDKIFGKDYLNKFDLTVSTKSLPFPWYDHSKYSILLLQNSPNTKGSDRMEIDGQEYEIPQLFALVQNSARFDHSPGFFSQMINIPNEQCQLDGSETPESITFQLHGLYREGNRVKEYAQKYPEFLKLLKRL